MTRRATRTSPFNEPDFATINRFRAVTVPLTWPRMFTSLPASDAVTLASSSISTSPVASTWPSTVPPNRTSPSMWSSPIKRSRGPSVTELRSLDCSVGGGGCSAVDLGPLAPGALLLKVAHADVTVQAGPIFDLEPANVNVPAQFRVLAEDQLVPGVQRPFDLTTNGDVRRLEQRLHLGPSSHVDVARDAALALGSPVHGDVAFVRQFAFETVVRPHRELSEPVTFGLLGSPDRRAL